VKTDKDGGVSASSSTTFTAGVAQLQPSDLYVAGTTGNEQIYVYKLVGGAVRVVMNGEDLGTFMLGVSGPDNGGVIVYAQAGDDLIELVGVDDGYGNVGFPNGVVLYGGDGNDVIDARTAINLVLGHGSAGNDVLWGGSFRNMLVGGLGADELHGGTGEDLLIGGTTVYDDD
jgi:Ca2+-binding RTX toxin-like protein